MPTIFWATPEAVAPVELPSEDASFAPDGIGPIENANNEQFPDHPNP